MSRLPRDEERRLADGLRAAIEAYEERQRAALARLRNDLQSALWPTEPVAPISPGFSRESAEIPPKTDGNNGGAGCADEEGTRYG